MPSRRPEVTSDRRTFDEIPPTDPPPQERRARLAFGPFVLDLETGRLVEGGRVIPLAPKPFETLLYLALRPGRVVSKAELMERLWPDTFVTDDVLVQCVVEIRRALGDTAKSPKYIQTLPRRGYQFLAPVRSLDPDALLVLEHSASVGPLAAEARSGIRIGRAPWVLAGLLVLALGAWLAGRRAAPPGPEAAAPALEPGSLVVMPVPVEEPTPQSGWLRNGLAEMIRAQLGQSPGIHVVARHRLATALAEEGYDEETGPSAEKAGEIARRLRAERLVTGSFVRVDNDFVISAQVVDVATGRTEGTASVRGRHPGGLLDAVDELCLRLLHHVTASRGLEPGRSWRPRRMATQSVDAYRSYVEALDQFARGGRKGAEEAEKHLDEALKLDPSFAQAYVKKAEIQQWRRVWGYGDPDPAPAIRAAARLVKDLPDRERLLVQSFEALIIRRQPLEALRHWDALLRIYPTFAQEAGVPGLVADTFLNLGRWDDLILVGEAHVDSPSLPDAERARLSFRLAQAFRRKGEFERALQHARRAVILWPTREGPGFLNQRTNLGRIALEAGRRDEALAEFRAVSRAGEADVVNLTDAAWGLYMAGEAEEAGALVERALGLDPSYGNAHHLRGWLALARRDYAAAAASLETAFERTPPLFGNPHQGMVSGDLAALYYAGVAYEKLGRKDRAGAVLGRVIELCKAQRQLKGNEGTAAQWQAANFLARAAARLGLPAQEPPRLQGDDTTYFVQTARLHAVQGKRELALRELAQGLALGFGEHRHIQDDPDFESLRAVAEFQRLVSEPPRP